MLSDAVAEDASRQHPERRDWLEALPGVIEHLSEQWGLTLGPPYEPGGSAAWIAAARSSGGEELVLKVGWRHFEAEHEAEALALWNGDGTVRCLDAIRAEDTIALLLERCAPGVQLARMLPEPEQDLVIAGALRRLWEHEPPDGAPFRSLSALCGYWTDFLEAELDAARGDADVGLAREALVLLRELPSSAERSVLLCTDLHAENVLSSEREPWLVIDPKPFFGDPAFDPVQHMLNCDARLGGDPAGLASRLADLLDLDPERVRLWLFARCAQESLHDVTMRGPARRLAP